MTSLRPWKSIKKNAFLDGGRCGLKKKQLPFMAVLCTVMLFIAYRTTVYQYQHTQMEERLHPFDTLKESALASGFLHYLPHGIVHASSDLELKPLWSTNRSKVESHSLRNLLAIPVGLKLKNNVDTIVEKFLPENFTVILFHYDGNVDGWWDLKWSSQAIHIVAQNQTKWWFAKRFLHPAVVSIYDYIFLWDEDLGVEHFDPRRYLELVRSEGLEISQPALDPNSTDIHHRITIRARTKKFHRRVYDSRGSTKCSDASEGPPCTGFVEGMAPVFSRSAWYCTWHLIQNDLVHGWGVDMKLGYCAQYLVKLSDPNLQSMGTIIVQHQLLAIPLPALLPYGSGDRTKKVGVIDSEYIVHKGIRTLGGRGKKGSKPEALGKKHSSAAVDARVEIRRQSTWELQIFKDRWKEAVKKDRKWVDPFRTSTRRRSSTYSNSRKQRRHTQ